MLCLLLNPDATSTSWAHNDKSPMYKVDWERGEVRSHSGFTVKTSPEAAATPSEA